MLKLLLLFATLLAFAYGAPEDRLNMERSADKIGRQYDTSGVLQKLENLQNQLCKRQRKLEAMVRFTPNKGSCKDLADSFGTGNLFSYDSTNDVSATCSKIKACIKELSEK